MTSIEWFFNELERMQYFIGNDLYQAYNEAKEMHKKEIIDAWENAPTYLEDKKGEDYYQETFGSKDINGNEIQFIKVVEQQLPQQEISDEEIEKHMRTHSPYPLGKQGDIDWKNGFYRGIEWYREQLKQRQ